MRFSTTLAASSAARAAPEDAFGRAWRVDVEPNLDQPADSFRLLLPGDKPIERKVGHRTNKACRGASEQHSRQVLLCAEVLKLRAHLKIQFDKRNGTYLYSALWIRISRPTKRKV